MKWLIVVGFLTTQTQEPPGPRLAMSQEMPSQEACAEHMQAVMDEARKRKRRVWVACFSRASP